jgi:NADPH:quinone reductase
MAAIRAVVVDPKAPGRLAIRDVDPPVPAQSEAVVRVHTTSINLGDVFRVPYAEAGFRPGWDLAGVVERAAADGSGPPEGARVLGLRATRFGAWAEQVAVPTRWLGHLPDEVGFAEAATLPTCGLTALYALQRAGFLLNRRVLVTGASGGLGHLVTQLAVQAGAYVIGAARRPERAAAVKDFGVTDVVVGENLADAARFGPFDVIVDVLGGPALADLLPLLVPDGLCLSLGISAGVQTTVDLAKIFAVVGGVNLQPFVLFTEMDRRPSAPALTELARMTAEGRLRPVIDIEAPWTELRLITQRFLDREITGKAVVHLIDE